ncbi:Pentatricopeptide repeat-containing protein At2g31400 [Durusdinium trenchii]|uniref:Chloroplastic n=1 Tax=Durusdinium trenchii TaxID=1381693 RepID=A0ABP0IVW5_9DINO
MSRISRSSHLDPEVALLSALDEATYFDVNRVLQPYVQRLRRDPRRITSVFKGIARADVAVKVLDVLRASRLEMNLFHFSALIGACERSGSWELAIEILSDIMLARQQPDVMCYMPALRACQKRSAWMQAIHLFRTMPTTQATPDAISYNAMIGVAKTVGNWRLAIGFLDEMFHWQISSTTLMAGSVMTVCQEASQWHAVLKLLGRLPLLRLTPDLVCFNIAISSCEGIGTWRLALSLLEGILGQSLRVNAVTFNSAITACVKAIQWQAALSLLWQMPSGLPDVISLNAAIAACSQQWQYAVELFARMAEHPDHRYHKGNCMIKVPFPSPDDITYNSVITACEKGGMWTLALHFFAKMQNRLKPNSVTYQGVLSACERESQWETALAFLTLLISRQELPSAMHAGSVIHSLLKVQSKSEMVPRIDPLLHWLREVWQVQAAAMTSKKLGELKEVVASLPGLVVASKPPGVSTEDFRDLLAKELKLELSIVSRLDHPTSGVLPLVVGNDSPGDRWVRAQFAGRMVCKEHEYACLCEGPSLGDVGYQGQISVPLRTLQIDETWQSEACDLGDGSEAVTDFEVMERYLPPFSEESAQGTSEGELKELIFLKVFPKTGRRHQIRVHFSSLSRPLVGDLTYGPGLGGSLLPTERLFLHCRSLSFLDLEGKSFQVNSSLPEELLDLLQTLDKMVPGHAVCEERSEAEACTTQAGLDYSFES